MSYIFMTGAPGSKWSAVSKRIYWSSSVNHSDYHDDREYYGPKSYNEYPMHTGAYWDPGMEFDVGEWDKPFKKEGGVKLIKSHTIAEDLEAYADHPIIMVLRDDQKCFDWWKEAGGFDISYPDYSYYINDDGMRSAIEAQNAGIRSFVERHNCQSITNVLEIHRALGLAAYPDYNPRHPGEHLDAPMSRWFTHTDIEVFLHKP